MEEELFVDGTKTFFGVWSPLDRGRFPTEDADNIDFGAWYITETGTLPDDPLMYKEGDWLIYICDNRGMSSERKYWKTTDGLALFNRDPSFNTPDPGHYTKILLDNMGNITEAGVLEYNDLPQEAREKIDSFTGAQLKAQVCDIIKEVFQSSLEDTVTFDFDPHTNTMRANAKIDEQSIVIDQDGYLSAVGGGEGGDDKPVDPDEPPKPKPEYALKDHKHKVEDIEGIDEHFGKFLASASFAEIVKHDLLDFIDGTTVVLDDEGYISVNPDIIGGGGGAGGNDCANHEHDIDDIIGLREFIKEYVTTVSFTESIRQGMAEFIDGDTISINKDGKLTAIAMHVGPHTHLMKDVTDLNPDIADTWASKQTLKNNEIDWTEGVSDLTNLNIGQAIHILNKVLKDVKYTADEALKHSESLEPRAPNTLEDSKVTILGSPEKLLDVETREEVACYAEVSFITDILWHRGSTYNVYIDGELFDSLVTEGETLTPGKYGEHFTITYYGDAYPDIKTFQGYYNGLVFQFESGEIPEGYHKVEVEEIPLSIKDDAIKLEPISIATSNPVAFGVVDFQNVPTQEKLMDYYVSGVGCCRGITKIGFDIDAICYTSKFAALKQITIWDSLSNTWKEVCGQSFNEGHALYTVGIEFPQDYKGIIKFKAKAKTSYGIWGPEKEYTTPYINRDSTHSEVLYRIKSNGDDFNPREPLGRYDAQIIDDNIQIAKIDWSEIGIGPDYTNSNPTQEIFLRFPFDIKANNFYYDIYKKNGTEFPLKRNGALDNIEIFAKVTDSMKIEFDDTWINCNTPWNREKYNSMHGYNALDLFRSTSTRRWLTFGDKKVMGKYLYLKIQITNDKSVDLLKLASSLQESLNERR